MMTFFFLVNNEIILNKLLKFVQSFECLFYCCVSRLFALKDFNKLNEMRARINFYKCFFFHSFCFGLIVHVVSVGNV